MLRDLDQLVGDDVSDHARELPRLRQRPGQVRLRAEPHRGLPRCVVGRVKEHDQRDVVAHARTHVPHGLDARVAIQRTRVEHDAVHTTDAHRQRVTDAARTDDVNRGEALAQLVADRARVGVVSRDQHHADLDGWSGCLCGARPLLDPRLGRGRRGFRFANPARSRCWRTPSTSSAMPATTPSA